MGVRLRYHAYCPLSIEDFSKILQCFPESVQRGIEEHRSYRDKNCRLIARCLLWESLSQMGIHPETHLQSWQVNQAGRPVIRSLPHIHFNFSYSEDFICCAVSDSYSLGVDIEIPQMLSLNDVAEVFHPDVLNLVQSSHSPQFEIIRHWTRLEAVLKAVGTGFLEEPCQVNTLLDQIHLKNNIWFLSEFSIQEYRGAIASQEDLNVHPVEVQNAYESILKGMNHCEI